MFPMSGFRSRFPTVTRWTTDQDLPDIVFRPCFTPAVSEPVPGRPSTAAGRLAAPARQGAAYPSGAGQAGRSPGGAAARLASLQVTELAADWLGLIRRVSQPRADGRDPRDQHGGTSPGAGERQTPGTAGHPGGGAARHVPPSVTSASPAPGPGPGPGLGGSFLSVYSADLQLDQHRSGHSDPVRWRLTDRRRGQAGCTRRLPGGRSWSFCAAGGLLALGQAPDGRL